MTGPPPTTGQVAHKPITIPPPTFLTTGSGSADTPLPLRGRSSSQTRSAPKRRKQTLTATLTQHGRAQALWYANGLKAMFEEVVEFAELDPVRRHNQEPPKLWVENDQRFLRDVRAILAELRKIVALLEGGAQRNAIKAALSRGLARHTEQFFDAFSPMLGNLMAFATAAPFFALLSDFGLVPGAMMPVLVQPEVEAAKVEA
jgi:hypothetical protein